MSTLAWKDLATRTVDVGGVASAHPEFGEGVERDECWALAARVYPGFNSYQRFTDRRLPLAVLKHAGTP
jgi:hypothetical protein